ncbi:MAG: pyridoxal-phosphate dependent enzyme [Chlamydiae bacterium]|nr:pyridoxal-phosphate dependent enzyme [Chlamydiota bacterium]
MNSSSTYPLLQDINHHSRIHKIPSFDTTHSQVWIKREDELGFLSMGVKLRKYLSLIPHIQSQGKEVAIFGSAYSNNVLNLSSILKERKIPFTLFLEGQSPKMIQGNYFFTLLCNDESKIIWVKKAQPLESIISFYETHLNKEFLWIPMGSSCKESLPGALTLGQDIIENERKSNLQFNQIFIDSGTGFGASSLILYFGSLGKPCKVYVTQTAGSIADFSITLDKCSLFFSEIYKKEPRLCEFEVILPHKGKSFGSIDAEHLQFIRNFAMNEGVFLDPIYNAKHFLAAKNKIESEQLKGSTLVIHSGGTLSLSGFNQHYYPDQQLYK